MFALTCLHFPFNMSVGQCIHTINFYCGYVYNFQTNYYFVLYLFKKGAVDFCIDLYYFQNCFQPLLLK